MQHRLTNDPERDGGIMARAGVVLAAVMFGGCQMTPTPMPGESFRGPLPPPSDVHVGVATKLRAHVEHLATTIGPRHVGAPDALEAAAGYVEDEFRALGHEPAAQAFDCRGVMVRNIEAEAPGRGERRGEIVIVGAHYDSAGDCPAANDNASGVAAMLEVARLLKDARLERTVRFVAFVNEEPPFFQGPLMGSVVYVNRCRERRENVVAMLSLETIGYYSDAPGSQQYPPPFDRFFPDVGNFISFVGDERSEPLVKQVVGGFRRHAQFPSEGVAVSGKIQGVGWSDHWSFWQAGYPGVMVTDTAPFRYPHYHRQTDTPDKIDYDRTSRVTVGVAAVVRDLAS